MKYHPLAEAIILQAVKDYRSALRKQKKNPDDGKASATIREIEKFFRSSWYKTLTDLDPDYLIYRLRKEVRK